MPKNLGELPAAVLLKIHEFWFDGGDNPVPQLYLGLALLNKRFYETFMDNKVWGFFDVFQVGLQGQSIAKHYLQYKAVMSTEELELCAQFDYGKWRHHPLTQLQFDQLSLYTQASVMMDHNNFKPGDKPFSTSDLTLLSHVARTPSGLFFAPRSLHSDVKFMYSVATVAGGATIYYAPDTLKDNKEFVLKCAEVDEFILTDCSARLRDDKQLVLKHLEKSDFYFYLASERLRDDPEVALAAVAKDPINLIYCSKRLANDKTVVLAAAKLDGKVLGYCGDDMRCNPVVLSVAIASNPLAMEYANRSSLKQIITIAVIAAKLHCSQSSSRKIEKHRDLEPT